MQLFRKINVSDVQKPKSCVAVKRFRADDLLSGERSILQSAVGTDIQRPFVFKEVLFYIRDESALFKKIIVTATSFTILLVGGLPDFCLVTEDVAPIKSDGTAFDLVTNGVGRAT